MKMVIRLSDKDDQSIRQLCGTANQWGLPDLNDPYLMFFLQCEQQNWSFQIGFGSLSQIGYQPCVTFEDSAVTGAMCFDYAGVSHLGLKHESVAGFQIMRTAKNWTWTKVNLRGRFALFCWLGKHVLGTVDAIRSTILNHSKAKGVR